MLNLQIFEAGELVELAAALKSGNCENIYCNSRSEVYDTGFGFSTPRLNPDLEQLMFRWSLMACPSRTA